MYHYKMRGYVLVTVLIFLQLFTCLGLHELASVSMILRENRRQWMREEYFLKAKQILSDLEKDILNGHPNCLMPISSSSELVNNPLDWWQQKTCHRPQMAAHYYMVESLGEDACGIIDKNQYNHIIAADYYRITLLVIIDKIRGAKLILQSTLVKPGSDTLSCTDKIHRVTLGRQMLRKLL